MLLWIKNALSPQDIRDKFMDPESDFQKAMVKYLEAVHKGEFLDSKLEVMTAWGTHTQGVVQGNYCLVLGLLPWVFGGCS